MGNSMENHPIWDLYGEFRTARLNVKYHAALLRRYQLINFWVELILALSASSSVASLWFWKTATGSIISKILGIITALLAVAKPLLKITEKLGEIEKTLQGYKALEHDFQHLVIAVRQDQTYDKKHQKRLHELLENKGKIIKSSRVTTSSKRLQLVCEHEVLQELHVDSFYLPPETYDV